VIYKPLYGSKLRLLCYEFCEVLGILAIPVRREFECNPSEALYNPTEDKLAANADFSVPEEDVVRLVRL
jgi:hypothetical protein